MSETASRTARQFGTREAFIILIGFYLIQLIIVWLSLISRNFVLAVLHDVQRAALHLPLANTQQIAAAVGRPSGQFTAVVALASYVISGAWAYRYARRRAFDRFYEKSDIGIGLSRPQKTSYVVAIVIAVSIILLTVLTLYAAPLTKSMNIYSTTPPGWPGIVLLIMSVTLIPIEEEFVFRGCGFAGLARSGHPIRAAAIVTILFVAGHVLQKIHYPLGLVLVALLAVAAIWLRIQYQSIWPSVFLHSMCNFGTLIIVILLSMLSSSVIAEPTCKDLLGQLSGKTSINAISILKKRILSIDKHIAADPIEREWVLLSVALACRTQRPGQPLLPLINVAIHDVRLTGHGRPPHGTD
ncbi:MAG TPA: CPBP family intramembrane glutamic endopeptidase [Stellaceae bacterium]|nr:CPBP family intramembrane glutamic endopeptidase [Stellaceae bacterium]